MAWAFVDYENTGSLKNVDLSCYERVIVLCGPRNRKFEFGTPPSGEFSRLELIPVTTTGPNNLDFHLAFHLGRFHQIAAADVQFRILSNDAGFDGLVTHLKKAGRKCKRVAVANREAAKGEPKAGKVTKKAAMKKAAKKSGAPAAGSLGESVQNVVSALSDLEESKRPKTEAKLASWIEARPKLEVNGAAPKSIIQEMIAAAKIAVANGRVAYHLNGQAPTSTPPPPPPLATPAAAAPEREEDADALSDELPF